MGHPEQHQQPRADRTDPLAVDVDLRPRDPLDQRPHQAWRSSAAAASGDTGFNASPAPDSSPPSASAPASRGSTSIRQQKCSEPWGAVLTHRLSGGI